MPVKSPSNDPPTYAAWSYADRLKEKFNKDALQPTGTRPLSLPRRAAAEPPPSPLPTRLRLLAPNRLGASARERAPLLLHGGCAASSRSTGPSSGSDLGAVASSSSGEEASLCPSYVARVFVGFPVLFFLICGRKRWDPSRSVMFVRGEWSRLIPSDTGCFDL